MGVRKNQNKLTKAERERFVRALLRMKRDRALDHRYDQYPLAHEIAAPSDPDLNPAHRGPAFCAWHRYFLARFEQDLQVADRLEGGDGTLCLPYWDWTNDNATSPNRQRGQIWDDAFMGGNGAPVTSGPFRAGANWRTVRDAGDLVREFGANSPSLPRRRAVDLALAAHGYDVEPFSTTTGIGAGLGSPPAPGAAGVIAGSLGPGVYQVMTTYLNGAGETLPSPPTAVCLGGACAPANSASAIRVASPPTPPAGGAIGWCVYVSPAGGSAEEARQFGGTVALGTDTTIGLAPAGKRRPSINTTSSFRNLLEGWESESGDVDVHNLGHVWVGGSMLPPTSPNDPVFFMHHCNIDRLWALWQLRHPGQNYPALVRRVNTPGIRPQGLDDFMPPWDTGPERVTPRETLNYRTLVVRGRPAGYTYDTDPVGLVLDVAP